MDEEKISETKLPWIISVFASVKGTVTTTINSTLYYILIYSTVVVGWSEL